MENAKRARLGDLRDILQENGVCPSASFVEDTLSIVDSSDDERESVTSTGSTETHSTEPSDAEPSAREHSSSEEYSLGNEKPTKGRKSGRRKPKALLTEYDRKVAEHKTTFNALKRNDQSIKFVGRENTTAIVLEMGNPRFFSEIYHPGHKKTFYFPIGMVILGMKEGRLWSCKITQSNSKFKDNQDGSKRMLNQSFFSFSEYQGEFKKMYGDIAPSTAFRNFIDRFYNIDRSPDDPMFINTSSTITNVPRFFGIYFPSLQDYIQTKCNVTFDHIGIKNADGEYIMGKSDEEMLHEMTIDDFADILKLADDLFREESDVEDFGKIDPDICLENLEFPDDLL